MTTQRKEKETFRDISFNKNDLNDEIEPLSHNFNKKYKERS